MLVTKSEKIIIDNSSNLIPNKDKEPGKNEEFTGYLLSLYLLISSNI
jgi:hypothetical protein